MRKKQTNIYKKFIILHTKDNTQDQDDAFMKKQQYDDGGGVVVGIAVILNIISLFIVDCGGKSLSYMLGIIEGGYLIRLQ